jgi:transcriptional regulator with XRE-family HTH domain
MTAPVPTTWTQYAAALGLAIARGRAALGLSQEQIAAKAGLSTLTWRKLESGLSNERSRNRAETPANPKLKTLAKVAQALGVPVAELLPPMAPDLAPGRRAGEDG